MNKIENAPHILLIADIVGEKFIHRAKLLIDTSIDEDRFQGSEAKHDPAGKPTC